MEAGFNNSKHNVLLCEDLGMCLASVFMWDWCHWYCQAEVFTKEFKKFDANKDGKWSAKEWSKYEGKWLTDDERDHEYLGKHLKFETIFPKCDAGNLEPCTQTLDLDGFLKVKFALGTHRNIEWFWNKLEL